MTWSVLMSVESGIALQSQSGFAESEAGGTLEGCCCGRGRSSPVAIIVDASCSACCFLCSDALALCVSACQWGWTRAATLRSEDRKSRTCSHKSVM